MIGVLLAAYGGPDSLDDVEPYLIDVRGGRPVPPPMLQEIRERYALIGGRSPLRHWTMRAAARLSERLGDGYRVAVGMRHWHPYIAQSVSEMAEAGAERLLVVPMSPYYAQMSVGAYADKVAKALPRGLKARIARSWHRQPDLIRGFAENLASSRIERAPVLFTAHSLPARIRDEGDPYPDQLRETAAAVARAAGVTDWHFAFQSPVRTGETWLGPFAEDELDRLRGAGATAVTVAPIGFLCDHVEILYDVDIALKAHAEQREMRLVRTPSLNDGEAVVCALAAVVTQLERGVSDDVISMEEIPCVS